MSYDLMPITLHLLPLSMFYSLLMLPNRTLSVVYT